MRTRSTSKIELLTDEKLIGSIVDLLKPLGLPGMMKLINLTKLLSAWDESQREDSPIEGCPVWQALPEGEKVAYLPLLEKAQQIFNTLVMLPSNRQKLIMGQARDKLWRKHGRKFR